MKRKKKLAGEYKLAAERGRSYRYFLEDKEYETAIYNKIMNASKDELAVYLTSPIEEERVLATIKYEKDNK